MDPVTFTRLVILSLSDAGLVARVACDAVHAGEARAAPSMNIVQILKRNRGKSGEAKKNQQELLVQCCPSLG
jgi:hypothetical protein